MVRWNRFAVIALACMMLLTGGVGGIQARTEGTWGFESGTLAGWTVLQSANHVGVTRADAFTTPPWGSWMAVLGQPGLRANPETTKLAMPFSSSGVPVPVKPLGLQPVPNVTGGMNTIYREFTANMDHLVFAYNVFSYFGSGLDHFAYRVSLLDGSGVIDSWPMIAPNVVSGNRTMTTQLQTTGWQVRDVDLSQYLYQQLAIEVSVESLEPSGTSENGALGQYGSTWAYFDVNPPTPIMRDLMPQVRFILPFAPGTMVAGTSMDVVIEAIDDQSIAEIRLLVNGTVAGSSMTPGRQTFHVILQEGTNTLEAIATDGSGRQATTTTTVRADSRGPIVTVDPLPPGKSTIKVLTLSGTVQDLGSGVRGLTVAGTSVAPDLTGAFSAVLSLVRGVNNIVIEAIDNLGNTTTQTFTVTYGGIITAPSSIYVVLTIGSTDMEVNGLTRTLDAAPFIKDGRTLLPIRALIEALGGSVQWNPSTRTATVLLGSRTIALTIGSTTALVNGTPITLDVAPEIRNGRTFLPLRAVAENMGLDLAWEPISRTISLTYWP